MPTIVSPIRRADLVHGEANRGKILEELIARGRLELTAIDPVPLLGYIIRPPSSSLPPRLGDWLTFQKSSQRLWLDVIELDELGSQLLVAREPYGSVLALSAWQDLPAMAARLRTTVIGPNLWETYRSGLLERMVEELSARFGLVKRALNSREPAAYAQTEWGFLLTLSPEQGLELFEYFCQPTPKHFDLPIRVEVGGYLFSYIAFGPDLVRLGLCWNGFEDPACLFLQDWLRKTHKLQPAPTS
jgi:hypothetical protein